MIPFQYKHIGNKLIEDVSVLLRKGESVTLLGPRNIGKRYVLGRLWETLADEGRQFGVASFLSTVPVDDGYLAPEIRKYSGCVSLTSNHAEIFAWVDEQLSKGPDSTAMLFAANVDVQPYQRLKHFLGEVRNRVTGGDLEAGRLVVMLTGEAVLPKLVHGDLFAFNCSHNFVLQGVDEPTFVKFAESYLETLGLEFKIPRSELIEELYRRTEGNVYFLRILLWSAFDRFSGPHLSRSALDLEDLPERFIASQAPWNYHIRYMTQLIEGDQEAWTCLERLLAEEVVPVEQISPHILELSGYAHRGEGRLKLAGTLARNSAEQYFTPRKFADLYARNHQWDEAFRRLEKLDPGERYRPLTIDEVASTDDAVKDLAMSLFEEATKGSGKVTERFVSGALLVLGFEEVSFWTRDLPQTGTAVTADADASMDWELSRSYGGFESEIDLSPYRAVLDGCRAEAPVGIVDLPDQQEQCVVAAIIPVATNHQQAAVIVGMPQVHTIVANARKRVARQLVANYIDAYQHALMIETDRLRSELRRACARLVNRILHDLGREVTNVGDVLKMAAQGIRDLGYKRVVFSLVEERVEARGESRRLVGVYEASDDPKKTLCNGICYDLNRRESLHAGVVNHLKLRIVRDATTEIIADTKTIREAQVRSCAVVPLVDVADVGIGTMCVERSDNRCPTLEEAEDLMEFGSQLAITIQQSEQANLLKKTLNKQPDPIAIVDHKGRIRYANEVAARIIGIKDGWHRPEGAKTILDVSRSGDENDLLTNLVTNIYDSMSTKKPRSRHLSGMINEKQYDIALLTNTIENWKGDSVAAFCHVSDFTNLYRLFAAVRSLQSANNTREVIDNTLEALRVLGHRWAVLYEPSEDDTRALTVTGGLGAAGESLVRQIAAAALKPDSLVGAHANRASYGDSIRHNCPIVFSFHPELAHDWEWPTDNGLTVRNRRIPPASLAGVLNPEDFWMDIPLRTETRIFGKLSVGCERDYRPEDFEFVKVFCMLASRLLEDSVEWERQFKDKTKWMEQTAGRVLKDVFHHIGKFIIPFKMLAKEYEKLPNDDPRLANLNKKLRKYHNSLDSLVQESRKRLLDDAIDPHPAELIPIIENACAPYEENTRVEFHPKLRRLTVDLDAPRFESALIELIANSLQCAGDPQVWKLRVAVEHMSQLGSEVVIHLRDNGPGVAVSHKERIFEPLFSHRPGKERGTGLGLHYVRRVIRGHGGEIVEKGDDGADFMITLPLKFPSPPQQDSSTESQNDKNPHR